jgi:hypothetical protein
MIGGPKLSNFKIGGPKLQSSLISLNEITMKKIDTFPYLNLRAITGYDV